MRTPYMMCPNCWDTVIVPVQGVELVVLHTSQIRVVTPVSVYRCSQWHVFAMFSSDSVATNYKNELSTRDDAGDGPKAKRWETHQPLKGTAENLDAMADGLHFVLNCYECGSTVLVPLEGLPQASGSQPHPPDVKPAAVVCDRCKHVRNYNLKNPNPNPSSGVMVSLPEASAWKYLGLLECPEPSCKAGLPLFARVSKPLNPEELERHAKTWVWHSLVCPVGHSIPDPQPAMIWG